jgi:hypothetical protein
MPVWILFLPLRVAELYNTCTKKQLASHIGNPGTQPGPRLFTVLCKQLYCSIDSTVQITVPCRRGHCGIGSTVQITVLLPKWYHGSGGTVQITVLGRNWYRYGMAPLPIQYRPLGSLTRSCKTCVIWLLL